MQFLDGNPIKKTFEAPRFILSGHNLVLQRVKREQAGKCTCLVSNLEGDTGLNSVFLKNSCKLNKTTRLSNHNLFDVQMPQDAFRTRK